MFTISTGDRRISEPSTVARVVCSQNFWYRPYPRLRKMFFSKISECEEEARRGNLTAESLRNVSVNNSMVNKSLEYWPQDEAVVSSMLEAVGDLSLDEEGVVEGSRINLRDFSSLGDYMKSHAHFRARHAALQIDLDSGSQTLYRKWWQAWCFRLIHKTDETFSIAGRFKELAYVKLDSFRFLFPVL